MTLTVEEAAADTYFSDFATLLSTPLQGFYLTNRPPAANIAANLGSGAPFNITGYATPAFDALVSEFKTTVDDDARAKKLVELQTMLHEDDGAVVWGFAEQLEAAVPGVAGVTLTNSIPQFGSATLTS